MKQLNLKYKLVRDFVREKLVRHGAGPSINEWVELPADAPELEGAILDKLREETREVLTATTRENLIEEIGDVAQALRKLADFHGISLEEIERKRMAKLVEWGGFEKNVISIWSTFE